VGPVDLAGVGPTYPVKINRDPVAQQDACRALHRAHTAGVRGVPGAGRRCGLVPSVPRGGARRTGALSRRGPGVCTWSRDGSGGVARAAGRWSGAGSSLIFIGLAWVRAVDPAESAAGAGRASSVADQVRGPAGFLARPRGVTEQHGLAGPVAVWSVPECSACLRQGCGSVWLRGRVGARGLPRRRRVGLGRRVGQRRQLGREHRRANPGLAVRQADQQCVTARRGPACGSGRQPAGPSSCHLVSGFRAAPARRLRRSSRHGGRAVRVRGTGPAGGLGRHR